jgi:hypothetical protein
MAGTVNVEILFDDEIYTGKWAEGGKKFYEAGDKVELPEATAEKLIAERKVRKVRAAKPKAKSAETPAEGEA